MFRFQDSLTKTQIVKAKTSIKQDVSCWASEFERKIEDSLRFNSSMFLSDIDMLAERLGMRMTGTVHSGKLSHAPDLLSSIVAPDWSIEVKSCLGGIPNSCANCGHRRPVALGFCHHCGNVGAPVNDAASYQGLVDRPLDDAYLIAYPEFAEARYEKEGIQSFKLDLTMWGLDKDDEYFSAFLKNRSSMAAHSKPFWCSSPVKFLKVEIEYEHPGRFEVSVPFFDPTSKTEERLPVSVLLSSELRQMLDNAKSSDRKSDLVSKLHDRNTFSVPKSTTTTYEKELARIRG